MLLDREQGPKAGNLLAFLEPDFVISRFRELPFDTLEFWRQTATSEEDLAKWRAQQREKIASTAWTSAMEGNVTSFVALTGDPILQEAALKAMKQSPNWIPATQNGRKVRSYKKQPIVFKLEAQ